MGSLGVIKVPKASNVKSVFLRSFMTNDTDDLGLFNVFYHLMYRGRYTGNIEAGSDIPTPVVY